MRVIFLAGAWTGAAQDWTRMREAFMRAMPGADFIVETDAGYSPWEVDRMRRFIASLSDRYDDGADTLLVGHSMGGILACGLQPRMQVSRVLGIATIYTPHLLVCTAIQHVLGADRVTAPIISFEGKMDVVVWFGAKHPDAIAHVRLDSNHVGDLLDCSDIPEDIAFATVDTLLGTRAAA